MSARPLETFQSEGWYRPGSARLEHYMRPAPARVNDLGEFADESLCGTWASGGGSRPWYLVMPKGKRCGKCDVAVRAELFRSEGPWFGVPASSTGSEQ